MLIFGDYVLSDRIVVERKVLNDFVKSIIDKRLFQQLKQMRENFEKPILIIEGEGSLYGYLNPNVIRGALAAITVDLGIPILWTKDLADTAGILYWIARREQFDEKREVSLRNKKSPDTIEEMQEFLISGLPDISLIRAKQLLKHFKKPENLFNASVDDLKKVKGIGEKIAKNIRKVLEKSYSD
jgi:Fanconi anemia group M protein